LRLFFSTPADPFDLILWHLEPPEISPQLGDRAAAVFFLKKIFRPQANSDYELYGHEDEYEKLASYGNLFVTM
jgi:hypothetical protein